MYVIIIVSEPPTSIYPRQTPGDVARPPSRRWGGPVGADGVGRASLVSGNGYILIDYLRSRYSVLFASNPRAPILPTFLMV